VLVLDVVKLDGEAIGAGLDFMLAQQQRRRILLFAPPTENRLGGPSTFAQIDSTANYTSNSSTAAANNWWPIGTILRGVDPTFGGGEFISIDVMTTGNDDKTHRLCSLIVTREDLLRVIHAVEER